MTGGATKINQRSAGLASVSLRSFFAGGFLALDSAFWYLSLGKGRAEMLNSISATASVSIAALAAANSADAKLTRAAILPMGNHVKRCANITYNGNPGGCATPNDFAASINSPLSTSVT